MSLVHTKDIILSADKAHTSAIAFICIDYNMVYSVVKAAEKVNTPAIIMLLPEHVEKKNVANVRGFSSMANELASSVNVPISVHLDHSYDYASIIASINNGFQSVMIDGSALPLEDNISLTAKVAETAHILGADVEAELGHVGSAVDEDGQKKDLYTNPEVADEFCRRTNCDYLTISIGNAHGVYIETPHLDIQRLEEIDEATKTPLVLHGGSGIPDEQLAVAFSKGINKFNVGTEFLQVYYDAMCSYTNEMKNSNNAWKMLDVSNYVQERMIAYLEVKLKLSKF